MKQISMLLLSAICLTTAQAGEEKKVQMAPGNFDAAKLPANTWVLMPKAKVNSKNHLTLREWTNLQYDPTSKRLIWFVSDGTDRRMYSNCLWFFDPDRNEWQSETNPYKCKGKQKFDLAYRADHPTTRHPFRGTAVDPVSNSYVQFSGVAYGTPAADTWAYDLKKGLWKDLKDMPSAKHWGFASAMVYVPELKGILNHGGNYQGTALRETWLLNCTTWKWRDLKAKNSPGFSNHHLVHDSRNKAAIIYQDGQTWIYDVKKNSWRQMKLEKEPPARGRPQGMAYDAVSGLVVMFGGTAKDPKNPRAHFSAKANGSRVPKNGQLSDTWLLDVAGREWIDLGKEHDLQTSSTGDLCYDPVRKCVFGVFNYRIGYKYRVRALRLDRAALKRKTRKTGK